MASLLSSVSGRGEDLAKKIRDLMLEKRVPGPERLRPAGAAVDGLEGIRVTLPGPSISMSTRVRGLRFLRGFEDGRGFEVVWLRFPLPRGPAAPEAWQRCTGSRGPPPTSGRVHAGGPRRAEGRNGQSRGLETRAWGGLTFRTLSQYSLPHFRASGNSCGAQRWSETCSVHRPSKAPDTEEEVTTLK